MIQCPIFIKCCSNCVGNTHPLFREIEGPSLMHWHHFVLCFCQMLHCKMLSWPWKKVQIDQKTRGMKKRPIRTGIVCKRWRRMGIPPDLGAWGIANIVVRFAKNMAVSPSLLVLHRNIQVTFAKTKAVVLHVTSSRAPHLCP